LRKVIGLVAGTVLLSIVLAISGCISDNNSNQDNLQPAILKISGSTTVLPIIEESAKKFMTENRNYMIEVSGGGSGLGIKESGENLNNIGMSSRDVKKSEFESYPSLKVHVIAKDGVAIIINPENPISGLTKEQTIKIYAGEITNWKDVGGPDAPINVYTRDEQSGTREVFFEKAISKADITKRAVVVASNGAMKASVRADKNGIGYLSIGYLDEAVKGVKFEGVEPTEENALSGKYIVSRDLLVVTNGDPNPSEKAFIDFLLSNRGQEIVKEKGYMQIK
jgi:phosphate transport system substrate-binding protein